MEDNELNNSDIISLYISSKGNKIIKIMKYVKQTLKTPEEISEATKIPIATAYRLLTLLEENNYLKSNGKNRNKKYCRGNKYEIIITPDGVKIK